MKLLKLLIFIVLLLLSGCKETQTDENKNFVGEYKDYYNILSQM
ncbi:hypothetical protein PZE06_22725 [Robertmurraya sp. DFI.2.37]|nr:hypothetical protein [Robertmurraya sp. DFI.2.37]MDF1510950.1 hypothetical protein [Robertmurraya sp. DFI.2.37]